MRTRRLRLLLAAALLAGGLSDAPAHAFGALAGRSFYMQERRGALVLTDLPAGIDTTGLRARVAAGDRVLVADAPVVAGRRLSVTVPLAGLAAGEHTLQVELRSNRRDLGRAPAVLRRLPPRPHAVQVDRLSGGLLVDGLPLLPVGFYAYSPVQPTLFEEEAVRGFNLVSPYQSNDPATRPERRAWMDRAAALGLKAHYQLLQVAGGGGVSLGTAADTANARRADWLRAEVEAFREHPSLLAWYIADEPTGHGATPEQLQVAADAVRDLDPYHPVSIVFMNPPAAGRYAGAMDLAMTDPYPIPNGPPASVGAAVRTVREQVAPRLPVWLVPQAFGGNEWWSREPTARELRLMSWLGLVEGATGLQYFIRHGLSGFPKSPDTWAAAGRVALETQALTGFLLSRQAAPGVSASEAATRVAAWRQGDEVLVAAANTANRPLSVRFQLPALDYGHADVEVLYEDRVLAVEAPQRAGALGLLSKPVDLLGDLLRGAPDAPARGVRFTDVVDAYGVRLYRLRGAPAGPARPGNLLLDPSFEWDAAPAVPAAVYADVGAGRGATAFVDGRRARHGRHSLRLHAPAPGEGVRVRPYAPTVTPGRSYRLALWARTGADAAAVLRLVNGAADDSVDVELSDSWRRVVLDGVTGAGVDRAWLAIGLASAGTAWIDAMEFFDISPRIEAMPTPMGHSITLSAPIDDGHLRYRVDGAEVTGADPLYEAPFRTLGSRRLRVALFDGTGEALSRAGLDLHHHAALGRYVDLLHPYSPRYPAGGPGALADGVLGTRRFADGRWQGFEGEDLVAVIDLGRPVRVEALRARFLQSVASWIWLPRVMEVNLSDDGRHFRPFATADHDVDVRRRDLVVRELVARGAPQTARYLRLRARSMGRCPDWHPGAGGPAWVFADEIRVEGEGQAP